MKDFEYVAAATVEDAVDRLAEHGHRAKVLAGGTDILVQLREGLRDADVVVDVKKIPELMEITVDSRGGLLLGAAVSCYRIHGDPRIVAAFPALTDAARIIGGWQIQGRASVGGNLCNSSPAADTIPPLIVESATCHIAGPGGRRVVSAESFCTGPGENVLAPGELLVALEFPPPESSSGSRYLRFIPRNEMDIAVVGAAARVQLDPSGERVEAARIALAAVAPTPVAATEAAAWLVGKPATDESLTRAGELARQAARPISDLRGPAEYRLHLVGVLTRRALQGAVLRARGGERKPGVPVSSNGQNI
ncbi:MAG: xanthine dehydrogenase family protein subunit M [Planctomycetota bacterium]|nr:xanthine dehydrogenase family protein subunit M [Planctomycetota bacterium]